MGVLAAGAIALTLALPRSAFGIGPQLRGCRLTALLARFLSASPSIARIRELCFELLAATTTQRPSMSPSLAADIAFLPPGRPTEIMWRVALIDAPSKCHSHNLRFTLLLMVVSCVLLAPLCWLDGIGTHAASCFFDPLRSHVRGHARGASTRNTFQCQSAEILTKKHSTFWWQLLRYSSSSHAVEVSHGSARRVVGWIYMSQYRKRGHQRVCAVSQSLFSLSPLLSVSGDRMGCLMGQSRLKRTPEMEREGLTVPNSFHSSPPFPPNPFLPSASSTLPSPLPSIPPSVPLPLPCPYPFIR